MVSQLKTRKKQLEKLKTKKKFSSLNTKVYLFLVSLLVKKKTIFSVTQSKQDVFDLSFANNVISNHKKAKKRNCVLLNFI